MSTNQTIDWEDLMISTERAAKAASHRSESAVAGLACLLKTQETHDQILGVKLPETLERLLAQNVSTENQMHSLTQKVDQLSESLTQEMTKATFPHFWVLLLVFFVGVVFGGYFAN